jgi:hypothetical protein
MLCSAYMPSAVHIGLSGTFHGPSLLWCPARRSSSAQVRRYLRQKRTTLAICGTQVEDVGGALI